MKHSVKFRFFFVLVYFAIVFIYQIVAINGAASGVGSSDTEQSTNRRVQLSRRTSAYDTSSNARTYMSTSYIKRVRPRIRYSTIPGVRIRAKTTDDRYNISPPRNATRISEDGKSNNRYYYSAAQKSFYNMRTINKQYKTMRMEHRRYSRDIDRAKTEMNNLRQKCNAYERNATRLMLQLDRQKKEFRNYQKETMNKIHQIETHQQSQDLRYFEVFEATSNNTAEISQLHSLMDNLNDIYGDIGDMGDLMPGEDIWDQQLAAQDIQLRYESIGVDDGTAEEIIERSYHRMSESIQPQLDEYNNKLDAMRESFERQTEKLEHTNSALREYNSALDGTLTIQDKLSKGMNGLNQTLQLFHGDLKATEARINLIEEQNQIRVLAFSDLQLSVSRINETLSRRQQLGPAPLLSSSPVQIKFGNVETQTLYERIEEVASTLQEERAKMTNLSQTVQSVEHEVRYLTMATSNFYAILTKQAKVIHQQNVTISPAFEKIEQQDHHIMDLENDLSYYHETVMKLLNIVTNLGRQIRRPLPPHKDCHDLWMSGHTENGVYTVVHEMQSKQLYCNMTDNGGWTIVQRRNDGSQDFDRSFQEYKDGFGNIYGEFWLGLDSLRWLTNGRIYTLVVILEDWGGNRRYAFYDQFCVFGRDYALKVIGYNGDAGDSLSQSNQQVFKVRHRTSSIRPTSRDCTTTHKSGWWFPSTCGDANPNGPYSRMANESMNFDVMNEDMEMTGEVRYMCWRGEDFPLKKFLMQIAPREAVSEEIFQLFSINERDESEATVIDNVEFPPPPFEVINSSPDRP